MYVYPDIYPDSGEHCSELENFLVIYGEYRRKQLYSSRWSKWFVLSMKCCTVPVHVSMRLRTSPGWWLHTCHAWLVQVVPNANSSRIRVGSLTRFQMHMHIAVLRCTWSNSIQYCLPAVRVGILPPHNKSGGNQKKVQRSQYHGKKPWKPSTHQFNQLAKLLASERIENCGAPLSIARKQSKLKKDTGISLVGND